MVDSSACFAMSAKMFAMRAMLLRAASTSTLGRSTGSAPLPPCSPSPWPSPLRERGEADAALLSRERGIVRGVRCGFPRSRE